MFGPLLCQLKITGSMNTAALITAAHSVPLSAILWDRKYRAAVPSPSNWLKMLSWHRSVLFPAKSKKHSWPDKWKTNTPKMKSWTCIWTRFTLGKALTELNLLRWHILESMCRILTWRKPQLLLLFPKVLTTSILWKILRPIKSAAI